MGSCDLTAADCVLQEASMPAGSQQLTPTLDPQLPVPPPKRLPPIQAQRAPSAPSPQACSQSYVILHLTF